MDECLDVFCHWMPAGFLERASRLIDRAHMLQRASRIPVMVDLEQRLRVMDGFPGYRQLPSLVSPPLESLGDPSLTPELARIANDSQAELVARHPDRFPAFVAALPLNNPDAAGDEATRAISELGACGVQVFTNVNGKPLDLPEHLDLLRYLASLGKPIWLHPARGMDTPDYPGEQYSKYEIWWTLGWPYETTVAMARLVFSGLFESCPEIRIITHHVGAMIPMLAGRLGPGLINMGTRTPDELHEVGAHRLTRAPIEYFKKFYADTASFGEAAPIECGRAFFGAERLVFASDMPFDPEGGPGYIRETLRAIKQLNIDSASRRKILTGNIQAMLGMVGV